MASHLIEKNVVVYDCEIKNVIDGERVTWSTFDRMGLSVACLYDYLTDDYSVYFEEDIKDLCERLNAADLVVGFNTTGFDNRLLRGLGGPLMPDRDLKTLAPLSGEKSGLKNWDMLYWSRRSIGWDESKKYPQGLRLDNHLEATFGNRFKKTADGAMAPVWWQEGKKAKVISYCLADVKRERMLFEHIVDYGQVSTAAHGIRKIDTDLIWSIIRTENEESHGQEIRF